MIQRLAAWWDRPRYVWVDETRRLRAKRTYDVSWKLTIFVIVLVIANEFLVPHLGAYGLSPSLAAYIICLTCVFICGLVIGLNHLRNILRKEDEEEKLRDTV